jgi:hypothetical protein
MKVSARKPPALAGVENPPTAQVAAMRAGMMRRVFMVISSYGHRAASILELMAAPVCVNYFTPAPVSICGPIAANESRPKRPRILHSREAGWRCLRALCEIYFLRSIMRALCECASAVARSADHKGLNFRHGRPSDQN